MMEARLHKIGYPYYGEPNLYGLTYPEIKKIIHGDNLLEEAKHDTSNSDSSNNRAGNIPNEQEMKAMNNFKNDFDLE